MNGIHLSKKSASTLDKIEETQAALRESIETAKKLAEDSERLIKKHRKEMANDD